MHANTRLSPHSRRKLVEDYLDGRSMTWLAQIHRISRQTGYRWVKRYRDEGPPGLMNRSSRPRRLKYRLSADEEAELLAVRSRTWWGPVRLAGKVAAPPSTIYRTLCRNGLNRRARIQVPVVRYEAAAPGDLVHLDVLQLFALKGRKPIYQFTVVDDCTRQAAALLAPKRTARAALQLLIQAQATFGFTFRSVLTDNDATFTAAALPQLWHGAKEPPVTQFTKGCETLGIRHRLIRVRRPQTNGKVERFHRTIREECWRVRPYTDEQQREEALVQYLDYYNHDRPHSALGGQTPVQRTNLFATTHGLSPTS
jgi:transposase InsO family protein